MNQFDPDHFYYDPAGNKITLEQWANRFESSRTVAYDEFEGFSLVTMYLGFVDPVVGARLFGTARTEERLIVEVEGYDSKEDAVLGHQRHADAIRNGFHCDKCRTHRPHDGD